MRYSIIAPIMAALWAVFLCLPAGAAPICGNADQVMAGLERQFGERAVATMLDRRGTLLRLLVNPGTGTWTMLASVPAGESCIVGFGEAFEASAVSAPAAPAAPQAES